MVLQIRIPHPINYADSDTEFAAFFCPQNIMPRNVSVIWNRIRSWILSWLYGEAEGKGEEQGYMIINNSYITVLGIVGDEPCRPGQEGAEEPRGEGRGRDPYPARSGL